MAIQLENKKFENKYEKVILFQLIILLTACGQSSKNNTKNNTSENKGEYIDMKSLFSLSPLSIFDKTTEGLNLSEKKDLLEKGESASWKIIEQSTTKLKIKSNTPSSEVTLHFLRNKNNLDGLFFAMVVNEKHSDLLSWKYSDESKTLQKADLLKKYNANDFVSKEDKLPDSYKPVLHYQFIDDQTIEVSLHTWMEKEFENRKIINKVFLKWTGEDFEERIVKVEAVQASNKFNKIEPPNYDLTKLSHDGKIVNKRFWQDSNGENIVLFTRGKDELLIYHYTINSDNVKLLRKVNDFEKDCDFDLTLDFIEEAIKITDLDSNNFGEITFAYKKACLSDVSPMDLKLVMLENGNKFIIRGSTIVNPGNGKYGGDKNVDASFNNAPDNFLSHANKIWGTINR